MLDAELRSVIVSGVSLNPQTRLTLKAAICKAFKNIPTLNANSMHTHADQKPGLLLCKILLSFWALSFGKWCSFLAVITVVDILNLPLPGNCLPEPHRHGFDLLFSHLRCEYALQSVNESLCCSTSVPYLDIIALIRWIKLISKSGNRHWCFGECWDHRRVALMICLLSVQHGCCFTVVSPGTCRLTSLVVRFPRL